MQVYRLVIWNVGGWRTDAGIKLLILPLLPKVRLEQYEIDLSREDILNIIWYLKSNCSCQWIYFLEGDYRRKNDMDMTEGRIWKKREANVSLASIYMLECFKMF